MSVEQPSPPLATRAPAARLEDEYRIAWRLALLVLVTLTLVKLMGHVPWIGTLGFTLAAAMQLYVPLWRAERLDRDYDFVGLHLRAWRKDLTLVALVALVSFPPFALGHHFYMTRAHDWLAVLGWHDLAAWVPTRHWHPVLPHGVQGWLGVTWDGTKLLATQSLGVALPEEAFYRGYLQRIFEERLPPRRRWLGVPLGRAAVLAAALFALGHYLGEWNPLRLGPFFPALVFAWMRASSGSIVGPVLFHALANVLGALLFALYR
ncbi:MAG: CPBP family intramembrane glutamic endopeptidase [Myxococcota bacterium]